MPHPLPSETMTLAQFQKNMEQVIETVERDNRTFFIQTPDNQNFVLRPLTAQEKEEYKGVKFNDDGTVDVELDIDNETYSAIDKACKERGVSFNDYCVAAIKDYVNKADTFDKMFKSAVKHMLAEGITAETLVDFGEAYKQASTERPLFDDARWHLIQEAFDEDQAEIDAKYHDQLMSDSDAASSSEDLPF